MADKEKLELDEVSDIVTQMLDDDRSKQDLYKKIQEAVGCKFTPDAAVEALPFIKGRSFALTDIADARNAGTRVFTPLLPNITISPVVDNEGEYERTDRMEKAWMWELAKLNRPVNGAKGVHDQIVESAVTYHRVALQTEYLPYKFKGKEKDPRIRALLARKCFQWTVHKDPGEVHAKWSDYGLERVAKVSTYTAQQLVDNFGKDNPGVQKLLVDDPTAADLMSTEYTLVDYIDWTHRVQYAAAGISGHTLSSVTPDDRFEFMNEKHELPFINWVIVDYGEPLWEAILNSGHWDNLQHMKLIKFSKAVALAGKPDFALTTPDGTLRGVWMDYKNPLNPLLMPPGTQLQELRPNQLDPQFETEYQENRRDVSRSTVAQLLQDPTPFLNAPFSTFNASITMTLGQLSPAKRVAESAEAEAIYQGFQWIKFSKIPFNAYRPKDTDSRIQGGSPYLRGGQIVITHEEPPSSVEVAGMTPEELNLLSQKVYFDLNSLYINVELQSANITDTQARLNTFLLGVREAGMPKKELWERMGWDGYEINQLQRANEMLTDAELQKVIQMKLLEVKAAEMKLQADIEQAAMQQAQAPQNQTNDLNAGNQFESMQGVDMRGGSLPAAPVAPNETREAVTGQTQTGEPVL